MPLVVRGYKEFVRACNRADPAVKRMIKHELRGAAEIVRTDASSRFHSYDARTAAGFRTVVRTRGVSVEQRIGRTTGLHPEFGSLQMRKALLPAADAKTELVLREFDRATDRICNQFERG